MSAWQPFFGESMDWKRYRMVVRVLEPSLQEDEHVAAILMLTRISTTTATLALTQRRMFSLARSRVTRAAAARDIKAIEIDGTVRHRLMVDTGAGPEHWGDVVDEDAVCRRLLLLEGLPDAVRRDLQAELDGRPTAREAAELAARAERDAAETQRRREHAAARERARAAAREDRERWNALAAARLRQKLLDRVRAACREGELPETIITPAEFPAEALLVFTDRCVLIAAPGPLSRIVTTTIGLAEITAVEYHAEYGRGVLEILTTTYHGAHWATHPITMPNTLPLPVRRYELMRPRIEQFQRLVAQAAAAAPAEPATRPTDLADDLGKLGDLHRAGVLTDDEFTAAKRALIDRA